MHDFHLIDMHSTCLHFCSAAGLWELLAQDIIYGKQNDHYSVCKFDLPGLLWG